MIDLTQFGLSPDAQSCILQALGLASVLLPVAEKIAGRTKNTADDKVVGTIGSVLRFIPRIRFGSK